MSVNKWSISVLAALLLLLQGQYTTARAEHMRWSTFGPMGGPVWVFAIDPQNPATLYASNDGPLFKSTDSGANWRVLNSEAAPGRVYRIAIDPHSGDIYAASGWDVFKSTDGGISWTVLKISTSSSDRGYWTLAFDTRNPGVIYAGSADEDQGTGALLKSTDGGATWRRMPLSNLSGGPIYILSVTVDPQNSDILYAASYADMYQSLDGGATWRGIARDVVKNNRSLVLIDPEIPSTLYLGTTGGVFKSTDRGGSWSAEPVLPARQVMSLKIDARDRATLYATTYDLSGMKSFKSNDRGASWIAMSGSLPDVIPAAWDPQKQETIYHTGNDGLFKSTDAGTSWRQLHSGLATMNVGAVVVDPQNHSSVYAFTSNRVLKSADGGRRWNVISSGRPGNAFDSAVAIDPQNPSVIYDGSGGRVSKSTDGGVTWQATGEELATGFVLNLAIDARNPSTIYAHAYGGLFGTSLFKSRNGGGNWNEVGFYDDSTRGSISTFAVNPHNSQILHVGTYTGFPTSGLLYRSTDGGSTWTNLTFRAAGGAAVSTFAFDPQDANKVYALINCVRLLKSTDAGASFNETGLFMPACVRTLVVHPNNPDVMYAATERGLYRTEDGGANWILESDVPQTIVWSFAIDSSGNKLYAAVSGSGIFATFDSLEPTPVPTLTLDSVEYCIGRSWTLKVSDARPDTTMRLHGVSNAHLWEIAEWNRTDANGNYEQTGIFSDRAEGRHLLYVEIDGASSNDFAFRVFNCSSKP